MSNLHGSVINFSDINKLPNRDAYLTPEPLSSKLLFLPTYLQEMSLSSKNDQKFSYKIVLMGIVPSGQRLNVILDDIQPYFEVILKTGSNDEIQGLLAKLDDPLSCGFESKYPTKPEHYTTFESKTFRYYQTKKTKFLRLYFKKLTDRVAAIRLVRFLGYETTTDDMNSYYRAVCRDHLTTFSNWAELTQYSMASEKMLKGRTIRVSINNYKTYTGELSSNLLKDKTMSCCWDIETWSDSGDLPQPENPDDRVFCIGMTFQWIHSNDPILKVCLCDYQAAPNPNYLTIVCDTEENLILAFAKLIGLMTPEFVIGFNDSDYDWRWIINRAKQTRGLLIKMFDYMSCIKPAEWMSSLNDQEIYIKYFRKEQVKVEADTYVDGWTFMAPGYLPIDVRTIFRRLYPTAEKTSLKWFLEENKLGGKEDMPYARLFDIYNRCRSSLDMPESLQKELAEINYYCLIDAFRCHELIKMRSVIMDHREVSNMAYVSLSDAFYKANGMKVRNLTIAIGQQKPFEIRFTTITASVADSGKYEGAYVFPPRKGLKISKLSIQERIKKDKKPLQIAELPKSESWANTTDEELALFYDLIEQYGPTPSMEVIQKLDVPYRFKEFLKEPIGRPITGLDFSSLYPSLIRTYNLSPEYCILDKSLAKQIYASGQRLTEVKFDHQGQTRTGWFVWHNCKYTPEDPDFQFGVYPYILNDLFNRRKVLKNKMKEYDHRKEKLESLNETDTSEYSDVVFNSKHMKAKQSAVKVFMNTFYGETGNPKSPFFVLEVAAGITSYGRKNIQFAHDFVKEQGCNVYYGDSVAEYTPVLVKHQNKIEYYEIKDLIYLSLDGYHQYNDDKEIAIFSGLMTWTEQGWTELKHLIRHKTDKQMYRVMTHTGLVDVTEDHSLLDSNQQVIKPQDSLGVKLLTRQKINNIQLDAQLDAIFDTQLEAMKYYATQLGNVNVQCVDGKYHIKASNEILDSTVYQIIKLPPVNSYVYDLETDNHHFSAGVGNLVVHNTDSLYLSVPESNFAEIDIAYYTGKMSKLDYWTRLVETTFKAIDPIKDGVNRAFEENNGTQFLSMAYEEVLYPVAFTAKKKYFGIAHESIANFKPKDLFIRGLEVKKRGVSEILREICMELMWEACSESNIYDLLELVLMKIDYIYNRTWNMKDFIQTGVYKPKKNNVKIKTFVERMRQQDITIKPNERFEYVIVQKYPYKYDARGRKTELSMGDRIELVDVAEKQGYKIDLDYYMEGGINGQLARLITYHDMFHLAGDSSVVETKIYQNACKFIEQYCSKYYTKYNTVGKVYQKIYRTVAKEAKTILDCQGMPSKMLNSTSIDTSDLSAFEASYIKWIHDNAAQFYGITNDTDLVKYGKTYVDNELKDIPESDIKEHINMLQKAFIQGPNSLWAVREKKYNQTMDILKTRLRNHYTEFMEVFSKYNHCISNLSDYLKSKLQMPDDLFKPTNAETDYTADDVDFEQLQDSEFNQKTMTQIKEYTEDPKIQATLKKMNQIYLNVFSAEIYRLRTKAIYEELQRRKNVKAGYTKTPTRDIIQKQTSNALHENEAAILNMKI